MTQAGSHATPDPGGMSARRWWVLVAAYVTVLFAMQPRLGFLVDELKELWGEQRFEDVMLGAAALAGAALVGGILRLWRRVTRVDRLLLAAVVVLYGVGVAALSVPQERLHYVEYGVLAGLIYHACRRGGAVALPVRQAALVAALASVALGTLDEILQGALWERRYFDWRDVQLNAQATVLGVLAAIPVERSRRPPS